MNWAHVRHIPVVDRDGRLVGVVTHRDLLGASISKIPSGIAKAEQNQHVWGISIDTIMNTNVHIISPEATVQAAAKVIAKRKDRLPTGGKPREARRPLLQSMIC
jgi:CBS domain-containing membrane protein